MLPRLPQRTDLPFESFGLSVGDQGHLQLAEHNLVELVEQFGSPLHVVDGSRLDSAADDALSSYRDDERHGCDIFYSYKTNPVPAMLRRLHDRGIGAEVISAYELWLALELGVPGDRIIYNGPVKSPESIRTAIERDVLSINANTAGDAERIAAIARDCGRTVRLGLRVALPGTWGGQFGINADIGAIAGLVEQAQLDPIIDLTTIHVHRGATIRGIEDMRQHVEAVLVFVDALGARTGWTPKIIDVGGSLACPTVVGFGKREFRLNRLLGSDLIPPDPANTATVAQASELAAGMITEWAERTRVPVPRAIMEPGRSLTSNSQMLLTSVVDVKTDVEPIHAILDAGINLAEATVNEYHQLFSVTSPTSPAHAAYRLAGPICTPADVLYNNWRLPELGPGHILAIMDTGAYFVPFSTSFSFPQPPIVICDRQGKPTLGRARETFDDLVRLDNWAIGRDA